MADARDINDAGRPSRPASVRVWDPVVRVFHWSLIGSILTAWLSSVGHDTVHRTAGYVVAGLIVARLLWGCIGTRHARFSDFVRGPRAILAYADEMRRLRAPRHLGHNPPGGTMILALLATLATIVISGHLLTTDAFHGSTLFETVHATAVDALWVLAALHIAGVLFSSFEHRENLIMSMLSGRKRVSNATGRRMPVIGLLGAAAGVAGLALLLAAGINLALLDDQLFARELGRRIERATGYELVLTAPPRLALWPRPMLVGAAVELTDGGVGSVRIARFEAALDIVAAVGGRIAIARLELFGVTARIPARAETTNELRKALAAEHREHEVTVIDPLARLFPGLGALQVVHGEIGFETEAGAGMHALRVDNLEIASAATGPLGSMTLAGALDGRPISVDGDVGWLSGYDGAAYRPVILSGRLAGSAVTMTGRMAPLGDGLNATGDLRFSASGAMLADLSALSGIDLGDSGDYRLAARVTGGSRSASIDNLSLRLGGQNFAGDVRVDRTPAGGRLSGKIKTSALDLGDLAFETGGSEGLPLHADGAPVDGRPLLAALAPLDAELQVRAARVKTRLGGFDDAVLAIRARKGAVDVSLVGLSPKSVIDLLAATSATKTARAERAVPNGSGRDQLSRLGPDASISASRGASFATGFAAVLRAVGAEGSLSAAVAAEKSAAASVAEAVSDKQTLPAAVEAEPSSKPAKRVVAATVEPEGAIVEAATVDRSRQWWRSGRSGKPARTEVAAVARALPVARRVRIAISVEGASAAVARVDRPALARKAKRKRRIKLSRDDRGDHSGRDGGGDRGRGGGGSGGGGGGNSGKGGGKD